MDRIPPKTKEFCNEYVQCQSCDKIYWKGTHFFNMEKVVRKILRELQGHKFIS
ncbi:MAG: Mut7-C RNAse domain-containing protein [Candidatus Hodarchaeales archaeon]